MLFSAKLISLWTIVRREVYRFFRIWTQTLLPPVITQSLYFVIFGTFIGSQVRDVNGVSYMAFIVPGLVMMAVITSAYANVSGSFFGAKFQKNYEEWLVSPTPNWVVLAGFVIGGALRGILVGLIVFGVSVFFTQPVIYNFGLIILFILLTAILFSLGGLLNAILATKFDDISIVPTFVLTPLTYLGGVFYSVKELPEFWQNVSKLNPILYMVDGFRYGFHGIADVDVWVSASVLIFCTLLLLSATLYMMKKGVGLKS